MPPDLTLQGWQSYGQQDVGLFAVSNLCYLDSDANFAPQQQLSSGEQLGSAHQSL